MRDPKAYEKHGRNDPLSEQQRREHPYDFVSLPERAARGHAAGHDRFCSDRLTGRLTLTYETETPLHVGSGVLELAEQCGLSNKNTPVRGIIRRAGIPVLPGSSWKGVVRSRFEAITRSRLGVEHRTPWIDFVKLPRELQPPEGRGKVEVQVLDPRVDALAPMKVYRDRNESDQGVLQKLARLSPAEALFGAMGYRGRIHPAEGIIHGPAAREALVVPPLESPAAHRLALPGESQSGDRHVEVKKVEGRKFYYDGPLVHSRNSEGDRPTQEQIDFVPAGCRITLDVIVESVTESELGALLVSSGYGADVGIVRFGGFKPAGLGKVKLTAVAGEARRGWSNDRWQRPAAEAIDPRRLVEKAMSEGFIDVNALSELHTVTTRPRNGKG